MNTIGFTSYYHSTVFQKSLISQSLKLIAIYVLWISHVFGGRVTPYGSEFIVISSTNPNTVSDYYFSMVFETKLPATGYVEIIFPQNQYPTGLTPSTPIIYAPYPNIAASAVISQWNVIIPLPNWPANKPVQIMIKGVYNPSKEGGTGQFQIQTLTSYNLIAVPIVPGTILDQSKHFTVLGLSKPTSNLISASVGFIDNSSQRAGEVSNYNFKMVPGTDLPYNVDFRITFPAIYDLTYITPSKCGAIKNDSGATLNGGFYCQVLTTSPNVLTIKGNGKSIIKGTQIALALYSVQNPLVSIITDLFKFEVTLASTNSTLELSQNVLGLYIQPGVMTNVQLQLYYPLYSMYSGFTRTFVLQFKPTNPFISARIVTDFQLISSCQITSGLLDTSLNTNSVCMSSANIMTLSNFQKYTRSEFANDYITVQFVALIKTYPLSSINLLQTQPVVISTFIDTNMLTLVDQDDSTTNTQMSITIAPQSVLISVTSPATPMSLSSLIASTSSVTFTLSFTQIQYPLPAGANYIGTATFYVEIPEDFTGIPICSFTSGATTNYSCALKNGMLIVPVSSIQVNNAVAQTLTITNLVNPDYPGNYNIRVNIYFVDTGSVKYPYTVVQTFAITSPALANPATYTLSKIQNTKTLLVFHFDFNKALPSGVKTLIDPFSQYSYIDIGVKLASNNYGLMAIPDMSIIDCISLPESTGFAVGLTDATGYQIQCSIFQNLVLGYVVIRVQNYNQMQDSQTLTRVIKIGVPVTQALNGDTPQYYIQIYTSTNKIVRLLKSLPLTNITPVPAGALPATTAISAAPSINGTPALPDLQQAYVCTIPLTGFSGQSIGTYNGFYMQLPLGYTLDTTYQLQVNGVSYTYGRDYFYLSRIQTIIIITNTNIGAGAVNFVITNVKSPDYDLTSFITNLYVGTGSTYTQNYQVTFSTAVRAVTNLALTIDYPTPQILWAKYTFKFQVDMKNVNILEFAFPAGYTIALNDPDVELINLVNIQDLDINNQIQLTITANMVQVSQFSIIDSTKDVSVTLTAITNPAAGTYPIKVSLRYANGLLVDKAIRQSNVNAVVSGAPFAPELINFAANSINSLPNNQNSFGIYIFEFQTTLLIPKGSVFTITFPVEYTSFYQKQKSFISCQERNSILYLSGCDYIDSTQLITMTTYADSDPTKNVIMEYYGLVLNQQIVLSGNFNLQIKYKGSLIFSTGTGVQPTITAPYSPLKSSSLDYYPTNEGERAYYEFEMQFNTVTSITKDQSILITFPLNYDDNLGPYNLIITSQQLQGALKYRLYKRQLVIFGFYDMTITGAIKLKIFGIVNPNRTSNQNYLSEVFGIGLLDAKQPKTIHGYKLIEADYSIKNISPQLSPGGINFISISSTNQYARQQSNFTFVIEPLQNVLSTQYGGQIYFDFPQDFIVDSYDGTCNINQSFSFFSNCYMSDETLRFFYETINPEWDSSASGYITSQISFIRTPDLSGSTNNFIAYNYDSINKIVLGRTYPNLFIASLAFSYQGRLITVNDDLPYDLEVGSFSDSITIKFNVPIVNYAAETTITLTPNVLDPSIIISPFPVILQYKQTSVTFKIAAPRSILQKTFYITWSKTGDTFPPTYADLRRTKINMVQGSLMRKVRIENIPYIPQDGESYPLYLRVPNPPYTGLSVQICFDNLFTGQQDYMNYRAMVNTTTVNFNINTNQMAYTVFFRNNLTVPTVPIYYQLSGVDMDSYELYIYDVDEILPDALYNPLVGQTINKVAANYNPPNFVTLKIQQQLVNAQLKDMITRTTVTLFVEGDQKGFLFYVVANKRIPVPTFLSVSQPSSNYTLSFSNPIYGANYIRKTNFQTQFTISDLTPGIDYEIYMYIMNMNLVNNKIYQKIAFSTLAPQNIAAFTMRISQATIISEVKQEYITKMASLVSIESSRIIERVTNCQSSSLDGSNTDGIMYWNLLLLPDSTNEDYLTTPINIVSLLNDRKNDIQQFIPRLDTNTPFIMTNLSSNIPQFTVSPYMDTRSISSVSIKYELSFCGTLTAIAIPRQKSENITLTNSTSLLSKEPAGTIYPTSYEIAQGLNMTNLPVDQILFITSYVDYANKAFNITFNGLNDRTVYDFYLSTINDFPIYNYYLDDNSVVKLSVKTEKKKVPLNIYTIQKGSYLEVCLSFILLLYVIVLS